MKRRVVITGLGVVAPNGIGIEEFWESIENGVSGIDKITSFNSEGFPTTIAGEVKKFDPLNFMEPSVSLRTDRFAQFGIAAAKMALEDSKLDLNEVNKERVGVCIGSGLGGIPFHEMQIMIMYEKGLDRVHPLAVPKITPNAVSSYISIVFGLKGPNIVVSTACSSGGHAIGLAMDMIRLKRADVVCAGGVEAPLTLYTFGCYCALRVMSKRNVSPMEASRPFDKERDGFVMGEGGGILMLEELNHAKKRKAKIYAEVLGYGSTGG
ncbi:MAG: beta-ketoacyl synthase N-terminal-like domain-containing protein, partial [bacterium]